MEFGDALIDIHTHILPGLDDGCKDLDDSLRMCELYVADDVRTVVATPHMFHPRYDVTAEAVHRAVGELREACAKRGLLLEILPGAEVRLMPELEQSIGSGMALTLAGAGRHLLLELPSVLLPQVEELAFRLRLKGIVAVLSHPERHGGFIRHPERLRKLVDMGCLVQITTHSLIGGFGRAVLEAAYNLLRAGMVHAVASDAHSSRAGGRRPKMRRAFDRVADRMGEPTARRLFGTNPARIARGESVPEADEPAVRKDAGIPAEPR